MKAPGAVSAMTILLMSGACYGAEGMDNRLCNMQGREIALRISEEMNSNLDAGDRSRIAGIAAEVCREFVAEGNAPGNMAAMRRPEAGRPAAAAAEEADPEEAGEDEERRGLFGNLRIIDPEDRVKRPGLKRP